MQDLSTIEGGNMAVTRRNAFYVDLSVTDANGDTVCVLPLTPTNVNWLVRRLLSEAG